jgi:VWFA-related protein
MAIGVNVILLLLQASGATPPPAEIRAVTVTVADDKGSAIEGLTPEEVAVVENGVARDLVKVEADRRPLTCLIVVDTSQEAASAIRLQAVEAIASFLARLPTGTRYALWTAGDRPVKAVDFTDDTTQAAKALKRAFYQGGNTLFDTLIEATRELKDREGERNVVLTVSGMGIGFTNYDRHQAVKELEKSGALFLSVLFDEGSAPAIPAQDPGQISRSDYEYVLATVAKRTGGRHETPLSPMGVSASLLKLGAELRGQYRLSYATVPGLKDRKIEVHVARAGAKVRVGVPTPQKP